MTVGMATAQANLLAAAATGGTAFQQTGLYVQLHSADPGAAGTTAVSTSFPNRTQVPSWNAASGGARTNSAAVAFTSAATTQAVTHFSLWSASTAGTFFGSGTVSGGGTIAIGNNAQFAATALSVAYGPLAA